MSSPPKTPVRPWPRIVIVLAVTIVLLTAGSWSVTRQVLRHLETVDAPHYLSLEIARTEQATGRKIIIAGPVSIKLGSTLKVTAADLSMANPPGYADAQLLHCVRLEAKVALLPLLWRQIDILQLRLVKPDVVLESGPNGAMDWDMSATQGSIPPALAPAMPTRGATKNPLHFGLKTVEIEDALVIVKHATTGAIDHYRIESLTGNAPSFRANLQIMGNFQIESLPVKIAGKIGPILRLSGLGDVPWPVDLTISAAGASARLIGDVANPAAAQGFSLAARAQIPALETLAKALPASLTAGYIIPPLHDVILEGRLDGKRLSASSLNTLTLHAGPSDVSDVLPGITLPPLKLQSLDITLAALNQPLSLNMTGQLGTTPLTLKGVAGTPLAFFAAPPAGPASPRPTSYPVALNATLGSATATLTGAIATPRTLAGAALAINLTIPDLASLNAGTGLSLPRWNHVSLKGTIVDPGGLGLNNAFGLDAASLDMDNVAAAGRVHVFLRKQPKLEVNLHVQHADLDEMLAALTSPPQPKSVATDTDPVAVDGDLSQPPWPALSLPLDLLRRWNADLTLNADALTWHQQNYSALIAHAVLNSGLLTFGPLNVQSPAGPLTAHATLDVSQNPAQTQGDFQAPTLALGPALAMFGIPKAGFNADAADAPAQGVVQSQGSFAARGNDLPSIAASLQGNLGLALVNGTIGGAVLGSLFDDVLHSINLPPVLIDKPGLVALRCAALRVDADAGIGKVRALTLDSSRLGLTGDGTIDFGTARLNLLLRPQLRVAGVIVGVPVAVTGPLAAPKPTLAIIADPDAKGGPRFQSLLSDLSHSILLRAPQDTCPAALSLARFGAKGPAPESVLTIPGLPPPGKAKSLLDLVVGQ